MQTGGASDGGVAVLHRGVRVLFCVPAQARSAQNHISIILPSRAFLSCGGFSAGGYHGKGEGNGYRKPLPHRLLQRGRYDYRGGYLPAHGAAVE